MSNYKFLFKRIAGYILGFLLFYEPFMFFQKLLGSYFTEVGFSSIHVPCARIPLAHLLTGSLENSSTVSLLFCLLLAVSSVWLGPVFCGRLCPAGAFSEFLAVLLPDKYKIDWVKYIFVPPVRYGFLAGFILSAWLGFDIACIYCNYYALELFFNSIATFSLLSTSASLFLTFITANIILGLFTKGGRGYCNFLCPVGASCSLLHAVGQHLPGTFKMWVNKEKCISCQKCAVSCPMRAITVISCKAQINIHHCIVCGKCANSCPARAITYSSNINHRRQ